MLKSLALFVIIVPFLFSAPAVCGAPSKEKIYELYNSTSTPAHYKRALEPMIARREKKESIQRKRASSLLKLDKVYAYPNPAVGVKHPVIHMETGLADKVEIKIFSPKGELVEEVTLTSPSFTINGGYVYEYKFASNDTPYGTCNYTVKAYKSGKNPVEASGRIMFIKMGNQ